MSEFKNDPTASDNRRNFTRIFFDAETVLSQGENAWSVKLIDVSLKGILVQSPEVEQIDRDSPVIASIHLGGDLQIVMELQVAHRNGDRLGLQCHHIELESLCHLRRLFELNVGDTTMLERELSALEDA